MDSLQDTGFVLLLFSITRGPVYHIGQSLGHNPTSSRGINGFFPPESRLAEGRNSRITEG